MTEDSKVRTAVPQDEDGLMALLRLMWKEHNLFGLNEDKVRALLKKCWAKDGCLIGAIGPIGAPVAATCVVISDVWYCDDKYLMEMFLFVHPDHRRSRNAVNLIEYIKECSKVVNMPLNAAVFGGDNSIPKLELFTRRLGKSVGAYFVFNREAVSQQEVGA